MFSYDGFGDQAEQCTARDQGKSQYRHHMCGSIDNCLIACSEKELERRFEQYNHGHVVIRHDLDTRARLKCSRGCRGAATGETGVRLAS